MEQPQSKAPGGPTGEEAIKELQAKVKAVAQGPDAELLRQLVDLLYDRYLEHDTEPLTEEDWIAIREGQEAINRGEFISWEELEKELDL
ncbi:MAG: hypothetical protein BZ151_05750 [Desulfobacca sp. 4484_104]|nr:MAG: hypothetical protein BZ151_05750 [Desulfobacca sp. 4484_104]RLA90161.1 MAG: hypothetical protein DRG58_03010 [Deltaproteobacteria bacterium]